MGQSKHPLARPFIALVVEDEPELRYMPGAYWKRRIWRLLRRKLASRRSRFLRKRAEEVAMMFVDVNLPGKLNGIDLALVAAHSWPWIRVVVTSGGMDRPLTDLPRSATFIPKPWRALDVLAEADRALAH